MIKLLFVSCVCLLLRVCCCILFLFVFVALFMFVIALCSVMCFVVLSVCFLGLDFLIVP